MRADAASDNLVHRLGGLVKETAEEQVDAYADELADWLVHMALLLGTDQLATVVQRYSAFRRWSQKLRRCYAKFAEVPCVEVAAHVRGGRPVRAHWRYLGFAHLRAIELRAGHPATGLLQSIVACYPPDAVPEA